MELTTLLRQTVSQALWPQISRVTILRTDDPFVEAMTAAFRTQRTVRDLPTCHVAGFDIPKALLFTAQKGAA